ncbi:MAG: pantoate--beta-alanine ligase [Candidatus Erginobacter occultus]|nr:pantoate--beta-alanine ligase [Candidatus Erginobacter occultus]
MKTVTSITEMGEISRAGKAEGKRIALVPTMGFLHEGHLSLIRAARKAGDVLVVSIFVNPAQFGPAEDLDSYPRNLDRDLKLCAGEGTDIVFNPAGGDIYPEGYSTWVEETDLSRGLCGAARPGHFRGVTTVVLKLFNIVGPNIAFFGRKDYQQFKVIEKMVRDLDLPVEIVGLPTVREPDGLAMSSRNSYLSNRERKEALCLRRALLQAREMLAAGETSAAAVRREMEKLIGREPDARIDYLEFRDPETLKPRETLRPGDLAAGAVFINRIRLIDNLLL